MKTLNELVSERIAAKVAKGMNNAQSAMTKLVQDGKMSRDFIFEVGTEKKGIEKRIEFRPDIVPGIGARFTFPVNEYGEVNTRDYQINQHAIRQVADKLKIPGAYLTSMLYGDEWQQTLAYNILNTHNGWTDRNKVLVRAVGNEVRAFLTDQYRRLNSQLIIDNHIEEIFANGAVLSDGYIDATKVMIESILPYPIELHTELNGVILLAFGTRYSTSDYGDGASDLRSFVMQGVCLNGLVRESVLRTIHLGSKLPDNLALSQKTYELDSATTASAIRDLTKNLFSSDVIKNRMLEVKAATDVRVDSTNVLKGLYNASKLLKGESEEIGKMLMQNNPDDGLQGESTLWKVTQGITAFANRESVTERRRMELQEIAGAMFDTIKK